MNKKVFIIIFTAVLFFVIVGILFNTVFIPQNKTITAEEAEKLCYSVLGDKDEETGFTFSFGVTGTCEKEEKQYYVIRASWLVNNSHMSYIGDFFVSFDGKEIYNGYAKSGEYEISDIIWSK